MPQTMVRLGSHTRGDVRLSMMLHGIWKRRQPPYTGKLFMPLANLKDDISDEVQGEASEILIASWRYR